MRSQPTKLGEGFDAPPTLERSGSEHRRAVTSLALLERARAWEWVKAPSSQEGDRGVEKMLCTPFAKKGTGELEKTLMEARTSSFIVDQFHQKPLYPPFQIKTKLLYT